MALISTMYDGYATEGRFHAVTAVKAESPLTSPPRYAEIDSVSGLRHSLTMVGTEASPPVIIEKTIATDGSEVMVQSASARKEHLFFLRQFQE
jgi:hypothetical protein